MPNLVQICPNLPKFHCFLAQLAFGDFHRPVENLPTLKPIRLPFELSGVCSPSEANYCSNPFEVFSSKVVLFAFFWRKWQLFKGNEYMYFYGAMCINMHSRLVCIGLYQIVQNISQYYYVDARAIEIVWPFFNGLNYVYNLKKSNI